MSYKCGDCGAKEGEYHSDGCDIERCPKCNGQLLSCDCEFPFMLDGEDGVVYERFKVVGLDEDFGMCEEDCETEKNENKKEMELSGFI